jgi:xanthine dehydrogenase YagS FAD-binding subunit
VLKTGEIVTEIILPPPAVGLRSAYRKVRARQSWDFALAGMASTIVLNKNQVIHCRMVLSGAAPVPWRIPEAEAAINGRRLDADTAAKAADAALKKAEPMSQNAYKVPLFRAVITQELLNYLE